MRTEPSFSADSDHNSLDGVVHSNTVSDFSIETESQILSDYCQRYGLSIDPFVDDPHFPFYTGAQRRQILEQLLHLCQFSHNLLVVAGDYGVGKTRMAQALIDALDDVDDICFVEGQVTSDIEAVFSEVFAQFELTGSLEFSEFCKKTSEQDGLVVLIVDNAHHLADDIIVALINLLQENLASRLHIVLFSEPHLLRRLNDIDAPDIVLTDLLLEKFSLNEVVDYLNFRMEMADYLGPEVFIESKVESWWRQAQGQLLSLHELAQEKLLASVSSSKTLKSVKSSQLIPHIVATSVLVGSLLFGYLYLGRDSSAEAKAGVAVATDISVRPHVESMAAVQVSSIASTSSVMSNYSNESLAESSEVITASAARESDLVQSTSATLVKQSIVPLVQTNSLDNKEVKKQFQTSSSPLAKEVKKINIPVDAPKVIVKTKDVGLPKAVVVLSDQEKTILSWGASEFTLQLMGLSNEKAAHDFIALQPNKKDLLLFKTSRQGKDWFVVVTGRFPSSVKARQAVQLLPAEQSKASPWPREVTVIQQEIKQH